MKQTPTTARRTPTTAITTPIGPTSHGAAGGAVAFRPRTTNGGAFRRAGVPAPPRYRACERWGGGGSAMVSCLQKVSAAAAVYHGPRRSRDLLTAAARAGTLGGLASGGFPFTAVVSEHAMRISHTRRDAEWAAG